MKNKILIILSGVIFASSFASFAFASGYNNIITIPNIVTFDVSNNGTQDVTYNFDNTFWANNSSNIILHIESGVSNTFYQPATQSGTIPGTQQLMTSNQPTSGNDLFIDLSNNSGSNNYYASNFSYSWDGTDPNSANIVSYNTSIDAINNNLTATLLSSATSGGTGGGTSGGTITGDSTIPAGALKMPTSTAGLFMASIGNIFQDPGVLAIIIIAVALPLFFWFVSEMTDFLPNKKNKK